MNKRLLFSLLAVSVAAACQAQAETFPDPVGPSQSDFGGVGLLQVPTARMAREGEFSLNFRDNDQYRYYSASLQLLPWLETTVRYTDVRTRRYSAVESFSGNQSYKDKAFDLKLRLLKESYWLPEVALGSRDLGGTGLFDSEYLVASKAWGPFDFTLGLGWGYLGNSGTVKNPFCSYSDSYCQRPGVGEAGSINGSQMFHGPSALFGGVAYQTPWQPLRLKLEYEGNDYQDDFAGRLEQRSKVNVGAIYRVTDWADINASYERGNTFMFGVTVRTNFNDLRQTHIDSAKPEYRPQPQESMLEPTVVASQLSDLKYNAGLSGPRVVVIVRPHVVKVGAQRKAKHYGVAALVAEVNVGPIGDAVNGADVKLALLLNLSGELLRVVVTFVLQLQAQRLPRRLILHAAKQGSWTVEHLVTVNGTRFLIAVVAIAEFVAVGAERVFHVAAGAEIAPAKPQREVKRPPGLTGDDVLRVEQAGTADIFGPHGYLRHPVALFPQAQFEIEGFIFVGLIAGKRVHAAVLFRSYVGVAQRGFEPWEQRYGCRIVAVLVVITIVKANFPFSRHTRGWGLQ